MGKGFDLDLNSGWEEGDEVDEVEEEEEQEEEEQGEEDEEEENEKSAEGKEEIEEEPWPTPSGLTDKAGNGGGPVVQLDPQPSDGESDGEEEEENAGVERNGHAERGEGGESPRYRYQGEEQGNGGNGADEEASAVPETWSGEEWGHQGRGEERGGEEEEGSDYNAPDAEEHDGAGGAEGAEAESKNEGPKEPPPKRRVILRKEPCNAAVPPPQVAKQPVAFGSGGGGVEAGVGLVGASVRDVAEHYSQRENQRKDVRESSPIIHLKKLNNWIKSVLIRRYTREGDAVLDLACGKGGDLIKWQYARIGFYMGVDVARGSIYDAAARYNGDSTEDGNIPARKYTFPAKLACADCYGCQLADELAEFGPFDVCSCQFALHYSFQSEARARQALKNVSQLLCPGGYFFGTIPDANVIVKKLRSTAGLKFGNLVYSIKFDPRFESKAFSKSTPFGIEYLFNLEDAVACPEWLIPFPSLQELAEEYGLELVERRNFHEFIEHYVAQEEMAQTMRRVVGRGWHASITKDEWDAAYLYCAFVFKKKGEKSVMGKRERQGKPQKINPDDILFIDDS